MPVSLFAPGNVPENNVPDGGSATSGLIVRASGTVSSSSSETSLDSIISGQVVPAIYAEGTDDLTLDSQSVTPLGSLGLSTTLEILGSGDTDGSSSGDNFADYTNIGIAVTDGSTTVKFRVSDIGAGNTEPYGGLVSGIEWPWVRGSRTLTYILVNIADSNVDWDNLQVADDGQASDVAAAGPQSAHVVETPAAGTAPDIAAWGDNTDAAWGDGTLVAWGSGGTAYLLTVGIDSDSVQTEHTVTDAGDPVTILEPEADLAVTGPSREHAVADDGDQLRIGSHVAAAGPNRAHAVGASDAVGVGIDSDSVQIEHEVSDSGDHLRIGSHAAGSAALEHAVSASDAVGVGRDSDSVQTEHEVSDSGDQLGIGHDVTGAGPTRQHAVEASPQADPDAIPAVVPIVKIGEHVAASVRTSHSVQAAAPLESVPTIFRGPRRSHSLTAPRVEVGRQDTTPHLIIGGTERTDRVLYESVSLSDQLDTRRTLDMTVYDRGGEWRPRVGQRVVLRSGSITVFNGNIDSVRTRWLRPAPGDKLRGRRVDYDLTCVAIDQVLDRHIINTVHENRTLRQIVRAIVNEVRIDGISMNDADVDEGPTFTRIIFPWITASRCLQILTDLSGRNLWIDTGGYIHMQQRTAQPAPFGITSLNDGGPFLEVATEEHRRELHNVQIVRGGRDVSDEQTELFVGDGKRRTFNVSLPVAESPIITVDGIPQTVGASGTGSEEDAQWYWAGGRTEITQDSSSTPLTTTQELSVVYRGSYNITIQRGNTASIAERRSVEGGSGRYEFVYEDRTIESLIDGRKLADARASRYGYTPVDIAAVTRRRGLEVGQLIDVHLPENGIDNEQYLIHDMDIGFDSHRHWVYTIQAISGEWVGGWGKFFGEILQSRRILDANDVSDIFTHAPDVADADIEASETAVVTTGTDSSLGFPPTCVADFVFLTDGGCVAG